MNRAIQEDAKIYRRQIIKMGEESKKSIQLQADSIFNEPDDERLGKWVREMMTKKIEEINNHINYIKTLEEDGKR